MGVIGSRCLPVSEYRNLPVSEHPSLLPVSQSLRMDQSPSLLAKARRVNVKAPLGLGGCVEAFRTSGQTRLMVIGRDWLSVAQSTSDDAEDGTLPVPENGSVSQSLRMDQSPSLRAEAMG